MSGSLLRYRETALLLCYHESYYVVVAHPNAFHRCVRVQRGVPLLSNPRLATRHHRPSFSSDTRNGEPLACSSDSTA